MRGAVLRMTPVLALAVLAHTSSGGQELQRPLYRAAGDAVVVDVAVTAAGQPVAGLGTKDFRVLDNGVEQQVDRVDVASMPLDVTSLLDTSGSVAGVYRQRLLAGVRELSAILLPSDQMQVVEFSGEAHREPVAAAFGMDHESRLYGDGGTALFDALTLAAIERTAPGRRRVIVALTDGLDTSSVLDRQTRLTVFGRSQAVIYIVAIQTSVGGRSLGSHVDTTTAFGTTRAYVGDYTWLLREITDATSGDFYDLRPGDSFAGSLHAALDHLRRRYLLSYRPTGVQRTGWHTLAVTVTTGRYDVRARKGYFGD